MKKTVRLTENDIHNIVKECVKEVISEASLSDKIQGAFSAKKYGKNFSQGFKHGKNAMIDSQNASQVSQKALQDLETAFKTRYNRNSTALSQMYQIHQTIAQALNLDWDGKVMLGDIWGIWSFPLEHFERDVKLKDANSPDNQSFRDSWNVPYDKDYVTIYSEICVQYRNMIKRLIKQLQEKVI